MTTATYTLPRAHPSTISQRPWLALVCLFVLFSVLGHYDLNRRATHDDNATTLAAELSGNGATIESGQTSRRIAVIALGVFAIVQLVGVRRRERLLMEPEITINRTLALPIAGFIALAACSTLWADDMALSARRVFVFLVLSLAAWAVARSWSFVNLLWFVTVATIVTLVASVAIEAVNGDLRPFDGAYRLSGLTHPNQHAMDAALAIAGILGLRRAGAIDRPRAIIALVVVASLLLLTRSRTGIVSIAVAIAITSLVTAAPRRLLGLLTIGGIAAIASIVFAPAVFDDVRHALLLGRNADTASITTLTGRTQLWQALLHYVESRPLLGYGFEAFWSSNRMISVSLGQGWFVPNAHSGYIETLLELGLAGLVLLVVTMAIGIRSATKRLAAHHQSAEAGFAVTMLVWTAVAMVTEVTFPDTQYAAFTAMVILARMTITSSARKPSVA